MTNQVIGFMFVACVIVWAVFMATMVYYIIRKDLGK
jgi:hypothetical protein